MLVTLLEMPPPNSSDSPEKKRGTRTVRVPKDIAKMVNLIAIWKRHKNVRDYADPVLTTYLNKITEPGLDAPPRKFREIADEYVTTINVSPFVADRVSQIAGFNRIGQQHLLNDDELRQVITTDYRELLAQEVEKLPPPTREHQKTKRRPKESSIKPHRFPVVGLVAAGEGIETLEDPEQTLDLIEEFGGEGRVVILVRGDSMQGERIFNGDWVIVQHDPAPREGDVVVAQHEGAFTLKKLLKQSKDRTVLQYQDGSKKTIALGPDDRIFGRFLAVFRKATPR